MKDKPFGWTPPEWIRLATFITGKRWVHFMHLSKTGGSALKSTIRQCTSTSGYIILLHKHRWNLTMLPKGDRVFFFMRDPVSRFISGFYSRQRQGIPRYYSPWSEDEARAFESFTDPGHLAESLSAENAVLRMSALCAMNSISHLRWHYLKWLISIDTLRQKLDQILFIGFQENLDHDFDKLKIILHLPEHLKLPTDSIAAHISQYNKSNLSEDAKLNLRRWYAEDFELFNYCREIYNVRYA